MIFDCTKSINSLRQAGFLYMGSRINIYHNMSPCGPRQAAAELALPEQHVHGGGQFSHRTGAHPGELGLDR